MSVSYGGDLITFSDNSTIGSGQVFHKNRLTNGSFNIDQRFEGAMSNTASSISSFKSDMWYINTAAGNLNCQRSIDVPTGQGFKYSMKINVASVTTSSNQAWMWNRVEGSDVRDFDLGTSQAKKFTVSFWAKCSLTSPTFTMYVFNTDASRIYHVPFTITSPNTWQKFTMTIEGDTTNESTWSKNKGEGGIQVSIAFSGSTSSVATSTVNQWVTGTLYSYTGITNFMTNLGAELYFTGFQLEKGEQATSYEFIPYDVELTKCKRYFEKSYADGVSPGTSTFLNAHTGDASGTGIVNCDFEVEKARVPSVAFYSPNSGAGSYIYYRNTIGNGTPSGDISVSGISTYIGTKRMTVEYGSYDQYMGMVHYIAEASI